MRLVVDASTLVAEVLRVRGRRLLAHPALDLVVAADAWNEAEHELQRRMALLVSRGHLGAELAVELLEGALATVASVIVFVPRAIYLDFVEEALRRVPRGPRDSPTVALALALDCGIWTADHDFFGCGVSVWTTAILQAHLGAMEGR